MMDCSVKGDDNVHAFLRWSLNAAAEFIRHEAPLTFHRAGLAQINRCAYEIFKINVFTEIFNTPRPVYARRATVNS